jgi:hypothetical protein
MPISSPRAIGTKLENQSNGREESARLSSPFLRSKNVFGLDDRNPHPFFTAEKRRRRKEALAKQTSLVAAPPLQVFLYYSIYNSSQAERKSETDSSDLRPPTSLLTLASGFWHLASLVAALPRYAFSWLSAPTE